MEDGRPLLGILEGDLALLAREALHDLDVAFLAGVHEGGLTFLDWVLGIDIRACLQENIDAFHHIVDLVRVTALDSHEKGLVQLLLRDDQVTVGCLMLIRRGLSSLIKCVL